MATTTIADVARRARVSTATVSRVLNGNYPVAQSTDARVREAVRDLGYVVNAHARALSAGGSATKTVGVLLHDVSDPYFAEIVRGIREVADREGRLILLCSSLRDPSREISYIDALRAQQVDGIIMASGFIDDDQYAVALSDRVRACRSEGVRLVVCGPYPIRAAAVLPDNAGGAFHATVHLLRAGHRRILQLGGPTRLRTTDDRVHGYEAALASFGVPVDSSLIVRSDDFSRDSAHDLCLAAIDARVEFSAVFAGNDIMAIGVLAALRERGIAVPGDVSVVGFDDLPIARDLVPSLTTVAVPMVEMGRQAMELILHSKRDDDVIRLPTELVERSSVAKAARAAA